MLDTDKLRVRKTPVFSDVETVREIVSSTGFFSASEIEIASELVEERLTKGLSSGYHFLFAEFEGKVVGYACYGPIPCTVASYDLYWIAVLPQERGLGAGRKILGLVEKEIGAMGGTRVYVDTASRELYRPTLAFYTRCGYRKEAVLKDFYGPGDDKTIFLKVLDPFLPTEENHDCAESEETQSLQSR